MDVEATSVLYIPREILQDILQKLPVKSLLRCKSVCKSWRALVSSPEFIKSHLNLAIKAHNVNPFYIDDDTEGYVSLASSINRHSEASQIKLVEFNYPFTFQQPRIVVKVLGSCNGMLLVGDFSEIFLWNPSTGDHKRVPNSGIRKYHPGIHYIHGLGYDSLLDEYKAVIFIIEYSPSSLHSPRIHEIESRMFIFSSRTGDWKMVDEFHGDFFPYSIYLSSFLDRCLGLTVNGFPHWVVGDKEDHTGTSSQTLVYFDMVDEKFKKLPTPTSWCFQKSPVNSISVLEGCLCAAHDNVVHGCVDVSAMKEYGVKESWTKLFAIRGSLWSFLPLGFINNGDEILFQFRRSKELMTCNLKTNKAKTILSTKKKLGALYVESLVSPL